jgi:hypothetical protein
MSEISARRVGSAAWRDALAVRKQPDRETIAETVTATQRASESDSAPPGGWLVNRLLCAVMGHRQLLPTAAAAKLLPSGVRREAFLCHACGSYFWKSVSQSPNSCWASVGV